MRFLGRLSLGLIFLMVLLVAGFRLAAHLREDLTLEQARPDGGRMIQSGDVAIHGQELGPADGPLVVMIHGTAAWSELWKPTMRVMADAGFRVVAIDLPPFGYSGRPDTARYDRVSQSARLAALAKALGRRPILVAHSFGAGAAVEAALRSPEAFAGLLVVNGAIGLDAPPPGWATRTLAGNRSLRRWITPLTVTNPLLTRRALISLVHVKSAATPEIADILRAPLAREGTTEAVADWLPNLLSTTPDARSLDPAAYAGLTLPTALIWGDRDTVTPPAQGRRLAGLIPGATYHELPEVGHIPQIEAPDAFQGLLLDVLATMLPEPARN